MQRENPGMAKEVTGLWGASLLRTAARALLVCVGYYVGANLGFILRFPPATPSVMWPPNAILTATLLLTPPRRWWIYLLAAFPAHLVAELGAGLPTSLVLALFATNCSEALLAAAGVRWLRLCPMSREPNCSNQRSGARYLGPESSDAAYVDRYEAVHHCSQEPMRPPCFVSDDLRCACVRPLGELRAHRCGPHGGQGAP